MEAKVGIVLVNYNGELFQEECLKSIRSSTYKNYEIIIVDNGSTDKSISKVKKVFNNLIILETGENNGVAKGNNIGIKKAIEIGCEYILLLNNDTEIEKDMISNMVKKVNKDVMVTCKMYYYNQSDVLWCAGGKIHWNKGITSHFGENQKDIGQLDVSRFVEYTPTCCLLIHKDIFKKVGFMDEKYFMYYDDTDFIARCSKKNIKVWYEASAKLWHKVSSSSGGCESKISVYYLNRNRLYFINKFCNNKFIPTSYFYITRILKLIKYRFNNEELFKTLILAIKDYKRDKMFRHDF